jgi:hypothetical protein
MCMRNRNYIKIDKFYKIWDTVQYGEYLMKQYKENNLDCAVWSE